MEIVVVTFKDGSEIEAYLNGNSLIMDERPFIPEDLSVVRIVGDQGTNITINDAELVECASIDGRFWFFFAQKNEEQKLKEKVTFLEDCLMEMSEEVYK